MIVFAALTLLFLLYVAISTPLHRRRVTREVVQAAVQDRADYIARLPVCGQPDRRRMIDRANPWLITIEDSGLAEARRTALGSFPGFCRESGGES